MRHLVRWVVLSFVCAAVSASAFANCDNMNVVAPTNASTVTQSNDGTVTLKWSAQVAAAQYDIYFGPVGSGCTVAPHATVNAPATQWSPPGNEVDPNTQYEWKVVATGPGLVSCSPAVPTTGCNTFTTAACPAAPTLLAPANGGTAIYGTVTLDWDTVPGAASYDVYGGLDGDPLSLLGTTTQTSKSISIEPGRVVEWKVVANAPDCPGVASSHFTFTTSCPTVPPNLLAPAPFATFAAGDPITLTWQFIPGANSYDVQVSPDDGGTWEVIAEFVGGNAYTTADLPEGNYLWQVRANFDGDCAPLYSVPRELFVGPDCDNAAPNLAAPLANATMRTPVTFQWSAVPGIESYRLFVQHADDGSPRLVATTTDNELTTSDIDAGRNHWYVVARFADCPDVQSAGRLLTIESDCPTAKATLVTPVNNASGVSNEVHFRWSAVAGATSYRVYASLDGAAEVELASTTNTEVEASVGAASFVQWSVQAIFTNNCSTRSETWSFSMGSDSNDCPDQPGTATLVSPAEGATNLSSPITFKWNAVSGATGYRVLASFNNAAPTSLGTTTSTELTSDVPAGVGHWVVQTLFGEGCPTTLSNRRNFVVTVGATCSDAKPQLLTPANGVSNIDSPVEFKWSAVPKATSYRLFVAAGDDEFAFYGETTGTVLMKLVPAGTVKWFVIANFAACPEVRSATSTFIVRGTDECANAQITLNAPAPNATTTSPVHMSWSPVTGAQFYRVWISIDGAAPVNIVRVQATEAHVQVPAGTIRWYVDATRDNCPAVVSETREFTVQQSGDCATNTAPTLVSPVGTHENPASATDPVTLTWSAVPNAIGYRIWISKDLVSFEDVALTQQTHLELDLEPGTFAWYAEAFFAGCDPLRSATAFFRISESTPRCPTGVPAVLSPSNGQHTTSPVTIAWTAVDEAVKYRVFVSLNGSEPLLIGATDETELTRPLPPGNIVVSVQAVFRECPSTTSEHVSFVIDESSNCSDEGALLVSPANDATNVGSPVDFVWNAVSGAVKYVLLVQVNDGVPTPVAATDLTHATRDVPPGLIRWRVVTFFSGCEPVESETFRFTVQRDEECERRKPIVLLPRDGDAVSTPVHFQWTPVPNAVKYQVWARQGEGDASIIASTTAANANVELPQGTYEFFVEAHFQGDCPPTRSARAEVEVIAPVPCGKPETPKAQVVGQALSNTKYRLRWTPLANVKFYEVQESTSPTFANAQTLTTDVPLMAFTHETTGAPVQYLYRVRGVSDCGSDRGNYSDVVGVFIIAPRTNNSSAEIGTEDALVQKVFLPGSTTPLQFTITTDKPWITVNPSSGTLPVEGLTVTVTADPDSISLGSNTGTIRVTYTGDSAQGGIGTHAGTLANIPFTISLVTPVVPVGKGTPPPDSLIFPVVGHAQGANDSLFESDIRVTNLTAQTMRYDLHFTPSNTDGTQNGRSSSIEIAPNATMALDDIVASLFGTGTTTSATGTLEVRPLATSTSATASFLTSAGASSLIRELQTAASSRTYNFTPNGTFGQYIPAVRFSDFVGKAASGSLPAILSLQQVSQSSEFRANFGFVEASGSPADLLVRVFDTQNTLLATIPVSLKAGEHQQINGMLANNGINNLADGRVEVEVVGGDGKVTAYVSKVDNHTNDPLLASAVVKGAITANKYVVPGVAYLNVPTAFWVTDMRVFNAGTTETPATLTFYPERNPSAAVTREIVLQPGEIEVLDNVLVNTFGFSNNIGGAIAVTTPASSQLNATARTYNQTSNGTYGQYIPGVTPAESIGAEDRALQILQVEQSPRIRTNIGLSETAGQPATVQISVSLPDSPVTPTVTIELQPNEFQQFSLAQFGLTDALYNGRVSVKVIGGTGRVTAYGSAIDEITADPTYVPGL